MRSRLDEFAVRDGKRLSALFHRNAGNTEDGAQLIIGHPHRAGRRCGAGPWLREGRRARSVESHGAFHLLHELMDMAVEDRHRAETPDEAERLAAIVGSPAPLPRPGPSRYIAKQHNPCRGAIAVQ